MQGCGSTDRWQTGYRASPLLKQIVPMLCVGMLPVTLCVTFESGRGASWASLPRTSIIVIHKSASTLIVPIACGHAAVTLRVTNGTD